MARRRILALALVAGAAFAVLPARAVPIGSLVDSFNVSAGDIDGTNSTAVLQAGGLYQITAEGSFTYKSGRLSDAECTSPPGDPLGLLGALGPFGWTRYGHFFYALNHPDLAATLPWDPDPTDDATDLYIDNRNVEWVPAVPLGFPPPVAVTPLGCSPFHSYETYFVPVESRQVNVRVFDTWYDDNLNSDVPLYPNGPQIRIYQIAAPPFPSLVHLQTVLVHTRDPVGPASTPLGGGVYLLLAHGEYKYTTTAGPDSFADAECSNGNPLGVGDGALWLRERYGPGALELLVNNADTLWIPLVPVPAEVLFTTPGFCDPLLHYYYQVLPWPGGALPFRIQDDNYGDNLGTLSVEIFKLL